jgi:hypothetical protein
MLTGSGSSYVPDIDWSGVNIRLTTRGSAVPQTVSYFVAPYSFDFKSGAGSLSSRHVLPIGIFVAISNGNTNVDAVGDLATIYKGMQGQGASVKELITPAMGTDAVIEPFRILTYRRLRAISPTSS